jgi:hypothetical protein
MLCASFAWITALPARKVGAYGLQGTEEWEIKKEFLTLSLGIRRPFRVPLPDLEDSSRAVCTNVHSRVYMTEGKMVNSVNLCVTSNYSLFC